MSNRDRETYEYYRPLRKYTYNVYYENADTDEEKVFIGTIEATYEGEALTLASEYYEHPSYDLIVKRQDLDTRQ